MSSKFGRELTAEEEEEWAEQMERFNADNEGHEVHRTEKFAVDENGKLLMKNGLAYKIPCDEYYFKKTGKIYLPKCPWCKPHLSFMIRKGFSKLVSGNWQRFQCKRCGNMKRDGPVDATEEVIE